MITSIKRTSNPASSPVTRDEMESQLAISADYEGDRTDSIVAAATSWLEKYTGQSFVTQTWTMKLDAWPSDNKVKLPNGPLVTLDSLHYLDTSGTSQELTADTHFKLNDNYEIPFLSYISSWPALYSSDDRELITVVFTTGYGAASAVPNWAKEAIKAYGTFLYEREMSYEKIARSLAGNQMVYFDWKLND